MRSKKTWSQLFVERSNPPLLVEFDEAARLLSLPIEEINWLADRGYLSCRTLRDRKLIKFASLAQLALGHDQELIRP